MSQKDIKQLDLLLNKFLFEYGKDMSSQSGCINANQFNCDDVMQLIAELENKK